MDSVDGIELAWARVAPKLDTQPLGVTRRIGRINAHLNRNAEEVFEGFKTTGAGMDVLAGLFAAGPPFQLTPTDLYRGRMMSSAGMTARLDLVESTGMVTRSRDPRDRRGVLITLTKSGQRLVREAGLALQKRQAFVRRVYTEPERKDIISLLERLLIPHERASSESSLPTSQTLTEPWTRAFPSADRWLLAFLVSIPLLSARLNRESERLVRDHGLTSAGWDIICALRRSSPERLSPGDLSRAAMMSSAGMTAQLDQLEKAGLLERSPHPEDRRAINVSVTRSGQKLVDQLIEPYLGVHDRFLTGLSARDRRALAALLRKLLVSMESARDEAAA
jgi:DNA-binding MarR family transcriptional regulator